MNFAQKIQQIRKDAGLSQEDFAEQLGVSRQSVSKWELGQTYPETDKLIEISRRYGVPVDSLLKDGGPLTQPAAPAPPSVKRYQVTAALLAALCLALAAAVVVSSLRIRTMENDIADSRAEPAALQDSGAERGEEPAVQEAVSHPRELSALRQYYFDFARQHRLDYVPYFEEGSPPIDSTEYLFFAFAVNLDNWGGEKGTMSRSYVEDTVTAYFGVTGLNHMSMWKGWDFDGETYTAYPSSIKELPVYVLQEYRTYQQDGLQYYEVTLDLCALDSGGQAGEAELSALRDSAANGVPPGFHVVQSETFLYCESLQNFDKPLFLAHTLNVID